MAFKSILKGARSIRREAGVSIHDAVRLAHGVDVRDLRNLKLDSCRLVCYFDRVEQLCPEGCCGEADYGDIVVVPNCESGDEDSVVDYNLLIDVRFEHYELSAP